MRTSRGAPSPTSMRIVTSAAALLLSPVVPAQAEAVPDSFCARMAGQFGMKPAKSAGDKPAFETRALKGLGVALFGGSTTVTMVLKPPANGDIGDPARFATACGAVANGLRCDVSGPGMFEMAVKDHSVATAVRAGELAQVSMVRNRLRCEDR